MIISSYNIRGLNKPFKQKELKAFLLKNNVTPLGYLETKIKPKSVIKVREKIYKDWKIYSNEAINDSGRICRSWKEHLIQVHILLVSTQLVHCKVKDKGSQFACSVIFVYGKNTIAERRVSIGTTKANIKYYALILVGYRGFQQCVIFR